MSRKLFDARNWSWLRLATVLGSGAAAVGAVLVPAAAPVLISLAMGLGGVAIKTPGFTAPSKLGTLQTPPITPQPPAPINPIPPELRK